MSWVPLFDAELEVAAQRPEMVDPSQMGSRLAWACAQVLPVSGAGISLLSDPLVKVPIGASDDLAANAERFQFTAGAGPCFEAHRTGVPVAAGIRELSR